MFNNYKHVYVSCFCFSYLNLQWFIKYPLTCLNCKYSSLILLQSLFINPTYSCTIIHAYSFLIFIAILFILYTYYDTSIHTYSSVNLFSVDSSFVYDTRIRIFSFWSFLYNFFPPLGHFFRSKQECILTHLSSSDEKLLDSTVL